MRLTEGRKGHDFRKNVLDLFRKVTIYKCSGSSRYGISKSQKVNGNSKYQSLCKKELFRSPLRVNYVVALNLIRILL